MTSEQKDHPVHVVVPDGARVAFRDVYNYGNPADMTAVIDAALEAAAPAIVAANQPDPVPEVECPACGATLRARMADQPDDDLRETLRDELLRLWNEGAPFVEGGFGAIDFQQYAEALAPAVEAFVAAQVAAARADAFREATEATETHYTISGGMGGAQKFTRTPREVLIFTGKQRDWLLAQVEADRG